MKENEKEKPDISTAFSEIFGADPPSESQLFGQWDEIFGKIHELAERSEDLSNYRKIRERMGKSEPKLVPSVYTISSTRASP